ncbi:plasmid stabilization protein [uncultured Enterovirga sp.]|uniref:FitA-like ribbon-helix-helix domain-containing protein n=1 Tax=uncultured Enterovirga sp. TaxID=2026352 RepID=UPI0035CB15C4
MATLLIRKLDDDLKTRLRKRAAFHGRSMAEEARNILRESLSEAMPRTGAGFVASIRAKFEHLGGINLDIPPREPMRAPPCFDE